MSLPKPYYEHAGITIYHADCRDILPHLPKVDLVLTDPPYGIGRDGKPKSTSSHGGHKGYEFLGWDNAPPTSEEVGSIIASGKDAVIWGANYFPAALPPSPGWLLWDKGQRLDQADGELAFTTRCAPLRVCTINRVAIATDGAEHPTQKPIKLMSWCLSFFPKAETVLDPFMGSGTTLVAAKLQGKRAIGIEREEKYCEIAVQRLGQDSLFMEESA